MTTENTENNPAPRYLAVREIVLAETISHDGKRRFQALGGLRYLRGNPAPYFSLTYNEACRTRGGWHTEACGANHDEILRRWPQFADLAALHLSDIDGAPTHAAANGFYHIAGYFPDAFGERYHAGNSERHYSDGYRRPTSDECLAIFAEHARITQAEAREIAEQIHTVAMAARHSRNEIAKAECARIMETMRPRWKAEAAACIAKHNLNVFGDQWPRAVAA